MIKDTRFRIKSLIYLQVLLFVFLIFLSFPAFADEKTIGIIMTGDIPYYNEMHDAFISKLRKNRYSRNIKLIIQKPHPDYISLSNAVRKLVAVDVDLIVTYGAPATVAVKDEGVKIPVVYSGVYEPVAKGIKSRNITGISFKVPVSSLIRYLKGLTTISSLGVIYHDAEIDSVYQLLELVKISKQYNFSVERIRLKRPDDIQRMLFSKKSDAFFITSSSLVNMAAVDIIKIARANKIPAVSVLLDREESGVIITLSAKPDEQGEKAALKVIEILKGTPVDRIHAESSSSTELIFNMKEANAIGLSLSMDLIAEATKIIK